MTSALAVPTILDALLAIVAVLPKHVCPSAVLPLALGTAPSPDMEQTTRNHRARCSNRVVTSSLILRSRCRADYLLVANPPSIPSFGVGNRTDVQLTRRRRYRGGGIRTRDLRVMRCATVHPTGSRSRNLREIRGVRWRSVLSDWRPNGARAPLSSAPSHSVDAALFRALAEPRHTLKLESAAQRLNGIVLSDAPAEQPAAPLTLRRGAIREAVIEVLMQADEALAPLEVRRRAASGLGRSITGADRQLPHERRNRPGRAGEEAGLGLYASTPWEAAEPRVRTRRDAGVR
jgi:hypothetical protein